jgi:hypothetical protein
VAGERGGVNARKLGRFISKHERRIEGGLRFVKDGEQQRALFWRAADSEFCEFREFFSAPSREETLNENGNGTQTDQWGRNSQNSQNSPPADAIEVDL